MKASIIIPTLDRADQLLRTLDSLVSVNFNPQNFEIIIIDNGSTDNTKDVALEYTSKFSDHNIHYFYDEEPGLLTGRHRGATESCGEILIFIDDDIHVDREWLSAILDTFEKHPEAHLVGGKCLPLFEKEPPEWVNYFKAPLRDGGYMLIELSLCDYGEQEKEIHPSWVWGLCFSIRKTTFYELGGFHPDNIPSEFQHFQGDGETGLSFRMVAKRYKAWYNPKIILNHEVPSNRMTIAYFDKRYFYQGVCDSFTSIRRNKGIRVKPLAFIKTHLPIAAKRFLEIFKNQDSSLPDLHKKMLFTRFNSMQRAGYSFHQEMVKKNPVVLDWVLRDDYLNYKIPNNV